MMEYERITDEKFVKAVETCNMACVYGENCIECVYFNVDNCPESIQSKLKKAILRLAELEDKIEKGTLVELPRIVRIVECSVEKFVVQWEENGRVRHKSFLVEKEAEKRLKELQG